MFKINLKNKKEKTALIAGALLGVVAGAFLPDQYNPVMMVQGMADKIGK